MSRGRAPGAGRRRVRVGAVIVVLLVAGWLALMVIALPVTVNAVAYLAGTGGTGTFEVTGTGNWCSSNPTGSECGTTTDGFLEPGGVLASWLGNTVNDWSFPVRLPVWTWGPLPVFVYDGLSAVVATFLCGGVQSVTVAVPLAIIVRRRRGSRGTAQAPTASVDHNPV